MFLINANSLDHEWITCNKKEFLVTRKNRDPEFQIGIDRFIGTQHAYYTYISWNFARDIASPNTSKFKNILIILYNIYIYVHLAQGMLLCS